MLCLFTSSICADNRVGVSPGTDTACAVRTLRGGALQQQLDLRSPYPYLNELVLLSASTRHHDTWCSPFSRIVGE